MNRLIDINAQIVCKIRKQYCDVRYFLVDRREPLLRRSFVGTQRPLKLFQQFTSFNRNRDR